MAIADVLAVNTANGKWTRLDAQRNRIQLKSMHMNAEAPSKCVDSSVKKFRFHICFYMLEMVISGLVRAAPVCDKYDTLCGGDGNASKCAVPWDA